MYTIDVDANATAAVENGKDFPSKIKNKITIWSSNPFYFLLVIYPTELKAGSEGGICISMFIVDILNSQIVETTQISMDRWTDKENMEIFSVIQP